MGFFTGRVTCVRFRYTGPSPRMFGPEHIEQLANQSFERPKVVPADGVIVGWIAADHILDMRFDLEKNIVNDALQFALRFDSQRVPSDLLRAYTQVELDALMADQPGGRPSAGQKREARQSAQSRLESEAADGRFVRRQSFPVLWDARSNEILVGTASVTAIDHFLSLFRKTFEHSVEFLGAGTQAFMLAEARQQSDRVVDAEPAGFSSGSSVVELAWLPDETNRDFLGNEFLLWLWYVLDRESDSIGLSDGTEVVVMVNRTLMLECPRGQTGKETIQSENPTKLPESKRAIQAGKLPRKAGLILARQDQQYELTLQAETLAIGSAKLPPIEEETERAKLEERVSQIRHLIETLDLLYDAFGNHRFGANWEKELAKIRKWMKEDRA